MTHLIWFFDAFDLLNILNNKSDLFYNASDLFSDESDLLFDASDLFSVESDLLSDAFYLEIFVFEPDLVFAASALQILPNCSLGWNLKWTVGCRNFLFGQFQKI
jgi:hypothetical protein